MDHYASGILKPDKHARLVANIEAFAKDAMITSNWISSRLSEYCSPQEIEWLKRFKFHAQENNFGLCLTGECDNVLDRMSSMAGGLLRNFIRARVVTLHTILGEEPVDLDCTALLIPNFFTKQGKGNTGVPGWKIGELQDLLMQRRLNGQQTILYVENMAEMASEYGAHMRRFIANNYTMVDVS